MNSVALSGNIGRDPEIRSTQSGTSILSFSLAVSERVKKGDEWTEYTNWVDILVFGRRADSLGKILSKGMKVAVSGKLRYSTWERDNVKRSKLEVIADDVDIMQRRDSQSQQNDSYANQNQQQGNYANNQQYAPQNAPQQPTGGYQQQGYQQNQGYQGGQQGYQQRGYQQPMDVSSDDIPFSHSTLD